MVRIGVFDSGVGGLSILNSIQLALAANHLPVNFAYCCDSLNFPYGTKSNEDVIKFVVDSCVRFSSEVKLDILVIACNTASTLALPALRSKLSMPIVGVVPAIKPAALASKSKLIGVLATQASVKSAYLESLIQEHAQNCKVIKCGSSVLVQMAEKKLRGEVIALDELQEEIAMIINEVPQGLDYVVLGCTHFPLLSPELRKVLPPSVELIDSGTAVAARVLYLVNEILQNGAQDEIANSKISPEIQGYCTGSSFEIELKQSLFCESRRLVLRTLN